MGISIFKTLFECTLQLLKIIYLYKLLTIEVAAVGIMLTSMRKNYKNRYQTWITLTAKRKITQIRNTAFSTTMDGSAQPWLLLTLHTTNNI